MGKLILALLVGLVGAAVVHIGVILAMPRIAEDSAWSRLSARSALFETEVLAAGSGPFTFVDWKQTDYVKGAKFSDYWQAGFPKVDTITWKPVPENGTRAAMLQTGEADFAFPLPTPASDSPTLTVLAADGSPLLTGCTGGAPQADTTVVVRGGDTLWSIVARALGPEASPDRIARDLPAWYDANRQVIGADPDLLLPGQILTAPSAASTTSSASSPHTSDSTDSTNTQGSSR